MNQYSRVYEGVGVCMGCGVFVNYLFDFLVKHAEKVLLTTGDLPKAGKL